MTHLRCPVDDVIIFPNSVASGRARGLDLRLEVAGYRGWSSYVSYTLSKVEQVGPINGGLYALNFGNPFSGTHFGAPRTVRVELRIGLR